jgi:predicted ester cyclase
MVVRRFIDEVLNSPELEGLEAYFTQDYVDHASAPGYEGAAGVRQWFTGLRAALPDYHYTVEDILAEGDRVALRSTGRGTMKGPLQGMPATGKSAVWSETHIVRMSGGKFAEHWADLDQLGMLQQLGLVPAPAG